MTQGAKRLRWRDLHLAVPLLSGALLQSRSLQSAAILMARFLAAKPWPRWRQRRSRS